MTSVATVTLWIARHALPLIAPGVCYGALDVSAQPEATYAAALGLASVLPPQLSVHVSPLRRCTQLAQALQALREDLHFVQDPRLAEMDFGHFEGVSWDAIDPAALAQWTDDFGDHRFGGVESANDVLARVGAAWDAAMTAGSQVWLTHAGVARACTLLSQGVRRVQQAEQWPVAAPAFGQWIQMEF